MVERINGKTILTTPISAEDLKGIKIGDIVYLNGSMTTCRDVAHRRLVEEGRELPVDVRNNAISMQDRSSVHSRMTNLRWYLLDRQQVCVWKNSSTSS